jgi:hypothetical protein
MRKAIVLSLAGALSCALSSQAAIETQTQTQSYGNSITPPFVTPLTFNGFNTALGTLTSVDLILTSTATVDVEIYDLNFTGPASPISFTQAEATFPVIATSALAPGDQALTTSESMTAGPFSGTAVSGLNDFPGMPATGTASQSVTAASQLNAYETTPTFTVSVQSVTGTYSGSYTAPGDGSGLYFGGSALEGGSVTVEYDYIPAAVPEPSTWFAACSIVAGSAVSIFRKTRRA